MPPMIKTVVNGYEIYTSSNSPLSARDFVKLLGPLTEGTKLGPLATKVGIKNISEFDKKNLKRYIIEKLQSMGVPEPLRIKVRVGVSTIRPLTNSLSGNTPNNNNGANRSSSNNNGANRSGNNNGANRSGNNNGANRSSSNHNSANRSSSNNNFKPSSNSSKFVFPSSGGVNKKINFNPIGGSSKLVFPKMSGGGNFNPIFQTQGKLVFPSSGGGRRERSPPLNFIRRTGNSFMTSFPSGGRGSSDDGWKFKNFWPFKSKNKLKLPNNVNAPLNIPLNNEAKRLTNPENKTVINNVKKALTVAEKAINNVVTNPENKVAENDIV